MSAAAESIDELVSYDESGLVPCVVQDWGSGEVLTLAYMNAEALRRTRETGELHLWSRSRGEQWHKGETSGNTQAVRALRLDCDGDTLLALVRAGRARLPHGRAHLLSPRRAGARRAARDAARAGADARRASPRAARPAPTPSSCSRTRRAIGEKVMEEAEEVSRAAREESDERVDEEAADVLYHLLVLLRSRGRSLSDAERVLDGRRC